MNRRRFLIAAIALGVFGCAPSATEAAPFQPTRFSVQVAGSGPDVILIPGLTAGRDVWQPTARALPGYRYHLIQVSGFAGEPTRGNARGPVVAPLADEIARYIVDRGLDRPAIVGHSMGGTVAMLIGARRPDLAGRIMVVDMLPQPAGLVGGTAADLGPLADSLRGMLDSEGGRSLLGSLLTSFNPSDRGNRRSDPDVVGRAMQELARIDLTGDLRRIRTPLTVVYASADSRDRAAVDRNYAGAYAAKAGARLVRIDNSGHMIMLDQPVRFRQALSDFLRR
ncbi:MAG TPA: alpha/beta hydrolase [Allosphingosinicella sp.]|nr:alpha/beta hydrolase [Allosphingosinicella sp.]